MSSPRIILSLGLLAVVAAALYGCPGPNLQTDLVVEPGRLEFGLDQEVLTFALSKTYGDRSIPPVRITSTAPWVTDITPSRVDSSGPSDAAMVAVTVDRRFLDTLRDDGSLVIQPILAGDTTAGWVGFRPKSVPLSIAQQIALRFTADSRIVFVGEPVQFNTSVQVAPTEPPILAYEWDFGDGSLGPDRFQMNPAHRYMEPGTYTVSLRVTNGDRERTFVRTGYVVVLASGTPVAEFNAPVRSVVSGARVKFFNESFDGALPIETYEWDFGDGSTGPERFEQHPVHVYNVEEERVFTVSLTVSNANGADTTTKEQLIAVEPASEPLNPPTIDFEAEPRRINSGEEVDFLNFTDEGAAPVVAWRWDFGDGSTGPERSIAEPMHAYTAEDATLFDVSLFAGSAHGFDELTKNDYILVEPEEDDSK
jgi:PKD repeat protein